MIYRTAETIMSLFSYIFRVMIGSLVVGLVLPSALFFGALFLLKPTYSPEERHIRTFSQVMADRSQLIINTIPDAIAYNTSPRPERCRLIIIKSEDSGYYMFMCWAVLISNVSFLDTSIIRLDEAGLDPGASYPSFDYEQGADGKAIALPVSLKAGESKEFIEYYPMNIPTEIGDALKGISGVEINKVSSIGMEEAAGFLRKKGLGDFLGNKDSEDLPRRTFHNRIGIDLSRSRFDITLQYPYSSSLGTCRAVSGRQTSCDAPYITRVERDGSNVSQSAPKPLESRGKRPPNF